MAIQFRSTNDEKIRLEGLTVEEAIVALKEIKRDQFGPRSKQKLARVAKAMAAVEDEDAVGATKVTIRLDNRVVDAFRALGTGYQAKINDALLRIVKAGLEGL